MKHHNLMTPAIILDELLLDAMSDAKLLEFTAYHYQRNLTATPDYPNYYFDVDDANAKVKSTNDNGVTTETYGYLMVKIQAADGGFKYGRKVHYKPETERTQHFQYSQELMAGKCDVFSYLYPHLNQQLMEHGTVMPSRNGTVKEFLNFKTIITDPRRRCVGGFNRNTNIFFLLAEALWIVQGRDDVAWLAVFNKQMAEYSDNGTTFHAPYGHRIRKHVKQDQLAGALNMLQQNPEDRRVVISIWDANRDLGTVSKDIPCNDMLMFKVREGKLYQTIQNRSNDLHWGLPTNVFQFSFLGEMMCGILGLEMGEQVHNSQSLHLYVTNPIAQEMFGSYQNSDMHNLYDVSKSVMPMDMNWEYAPFSKDEVGERLAYVDQVIAEIMDMVTRVHACTYYESQTDFMARIRQFSTFFAYVAEVLVIYVDYANTKRTDANRVAAIRRITQLRSIGEYHSYMTDVECLAINFFVTRLKTPHDIVTVNGNYGVL